MPLPSSISPQSHFISHHAYSKTLAIIVAVAAVATPATASPIPSSMGSHTLTKNVVAGVNNIDCKTTAARPNPVILVHGLLSSEDQWATFAERFVKL
ncbi:hypothetical protein BGZ82_005861 [Podila clonocystis]|nr:hypothetical protein BGZ82_005861 [Podila clonocystis]